MSTTKIPFEFQTREDEELTLEDAVFQALGAASACWENLEGAGAFQPERAKAIGDALLAFIADVEGPPIGCDDDNCPVVAASTCRGPDGQNTCTLPRFHEGECALAGERA